MAPLPYHGPLKYGDHGTLVNALKRATYRELNDGAKWNGYVAQTVEQKRTFGHAFVGDLTLAQRQMTAGVKEGVMDQPTLRALEGRGRFDAEARRLWLAWKPAPPPVPPLIQPHQGWGSLVEDLWRAYTIGRGMGFTDLGTYNSASVLPGSGAASDHATSRLDGRICEPACAFDMGFTPATGQANPVAKGFFDRMIGRKEVHYTILGSKIWSTELGLHDYGDSSSHAGHVHTSGHRR